MIYERKNDYKQCREEQKMPKFLSAILDALSTIAGPLGFPGKFALRLYDDEKAEERDAKLHATLYEGQSISRESLEKIFEIKNEVIEIREQLINGIMGLAQIIERGKRTLPSPLVIEDELKHYITHRGDIMEENKFITRKEINEELEKLYGADIELFKTTVGNAGFKVAMIPWGNAPRVVIFRFLEICQGYELKTKANIFRELSNEFPGSDILRSVAALLQEEQKVD
jgi:hypothetical protein